MQAAQEFQLYRPKPTDLLAFLPFACQQLEAPFHLRILLETIEEYVRQLPGEDKNKKTTRDKATVQVQASNKNHSVVNEGSAPKENFIDENEVLLRLRCEPSGKPIELLLYRCTYVPRMLMRIISLCIPYHEQLTKITIRRVPLDGSIIYEIAKFLPLSQVTDICLDDSPVQHRNYHLLLEPPSRLRRLSLARCDLADEECVQLAARLAFPLPAARTLALLSLEGNRIGDEGACALADALRTNRSLRHLNLAGNALGNVGVAHILRTLAQFPLTSAEILTKRRRTFEYLKLKQEAYRRCYRELEQMPEPTEDSRGRKRTVAGRSRRGSAVSLTSMRTGAPDTLASRAEALVTEMLGAYSDPLEASELVTRDDVVYCVGNFSISYLNLAYNNLDCTTAQRLAAVLAYQASSARGAGNGGLVRAVLEGNAVEAACGAARDAGQLLAAALAAADSAATMQSRVVRKGNRPKFNK